MTEAELHQIMASVRRIARKYRHTPLGEDALGVGNLAIVEAAGMWEPDKGMTLSSWCLTKASWAMASACRSAHGDRYHQSVEFCSDFSDIIDQGKWDCGSALYLLQGLPGRVRLVAVLHAIGTPHNDIAARLGVTRSRVSQILAEARSMLSATMVA